MTECTALRWIPNEFLKNLSQMNCLLSMLLKRMSTMLIKITWLTICIPFILTLTGNSLSNSYKCRTGPASRFFIRGKSKSWTCFEQCFNWDACQITLMCSLVIFPSTAKKFSNTWDCLITSTWRFGPKMCSTIFWFRIQPANWSPTFSTSTTDSEIHTRTDIDYWNSLHNCLVCWKLTGITHFVE